MSTEKELTPEEQETFKYTAELYASLDKLVRGMQLYQGKGGLVDRLLKDVESKIKMAVKKENTVKVTPIGLFCHNVPLTNEGKAGKYIFQMYRDGIREFTLLPDIDVKEIHELVSIFNADFGSIEDDLVTLLWKANFKGIKYYAVDSLGEQDSETLDDMSLLENANTGVQSMSEGEEMQFSSSDMRLLKNRDSVNWVQICSAPFGVETSMKNIVSQISQHWIQHDYPRFLAIALKVSQQNPNDDSKSLLIQHFFASMIQNNNIEAIVGILDGLSLLATKGVTSALQVLSSICSEEQISNLKDLFVINHEKLTPVFETIVSIKGFDATVFIGLLESFESGDAREALQRILLKSSIDMTPFYLSALKSEKEAQVLEAIEVLGQLKTEKSVQALYGCLGHPLTQVRTAALKGIDGVFIASEMKLFTKVLRDVDRENRMMALDICNSVNQKELAGILLGIVQEPAFSRRDMDEQQQFFHALHQYPSPTVFGFLTDILKERNIMRSKTLVHKQIFAVEVFEKMGTDDAKGMLRTVAGNWFLPAEVKQKMKEVL